ncbi:hypothetical protein TIFTF001_012851 [Ficus carica]|uniref:GDSL esterase/lipase n=1 Tax=Ficus carica TaxID=3494 RepID=A0AA88AGN8_FICCA|nr:hypothetical protein TIFTF001_012851 [Ficus carica]
MEHLNKRFQVFLNIFLIYHLLWLIISQAQALKSSKPTRAPNNITASAIFVFGDSTSDPGNNNYIATIFKGNFLPYGRDFANRKPTGRFTNGRLSTDFIASYVGLKEYVPPYLDPSLSTKELMTGVSFASAGTGFDPLTSKLSDVIPLEKQLEYFKEYKKRIGSEIGIQQAEDHVKKAVFIVSAGTNDFVVNYYTVPIRRKIYTVSSYEQFVILHVQHFLQGLWAEGARRIAVAGLPPMGCLPIVITFNSANGLKQRDCLDSYSSVARIYNKILQNELQLMHHSLASFGAKISYVDIYEPLMQMIQGPKKFDLLVTVPVLRILEDLFQIFES